MERTDQHQLVKVGRPTVFPRHEVVDVAAPIGRVAARNFAVTVGPAEQGPPLGVGSEAPSPPVIQEFRWRPEKAPK